MALSKTVKLDMLPFEAEIAQRLCIEYATSSLAPGCPRSIRPLAESQQTQVYFVELASGEQVVVKRHKESGSFNRELLALTMFEELELTPRLVASPDEKNKLLLMEYLPTRFSVMSCVDFSNVASVIGRLHGFANLCMQKMQLGGAGQYPCLADQLGVASGLPARIIAELIEVVGADYCTASIGDIKPEHLRKGKVGCVLVDLETFCWNRIEVLDLFQLVTFPTDACSLALRDRLVCESYCLARNTIQLWPIGPDRLFDWLTLARKKLNSPHDESVCGQYHQI
ncbi:aminoglycoside phosphotransferase/kinase family protein [Rhodopirellula baltica]|nr:hypothetical protein [Rhodopirellula baltica]